MHEDARLTDDGAAALAAEALRHVASGQVVGLGTGHAAGAVDGADEVDPRGELIKGYGGALLREKVVASLARRFVVLVGADKLVPVLGSRGRLPVEVVPFAAGPCRRRLEALGYPAALRTADGAPVVTDNGNRLLDCRVGPIADPAALEAALRAIPGVVGTGLFVGMRPAVLVWDGARCRTLTRESRN